MYGAEWLVTTRSGITLTLPTGLPDADYFLLLAAGAISVFPLYLFARAATGLPLSVMGLFQFVLPTTQLIVALVFYKQAISTQTLACFGVIWLALAIVVLEPLLRLPRQPRKGLP